MSVITAAVTVGAPDTLRPRLSLGGTANASGQILGIDRLPAVASGVTFLWQPPNGPAFETAGVPDPGTPPPRWRSSWVVDQVGYWAVRVRCLDPQIQLDWMGFTVVAGPGETGQPSGAIWMSDESTAVTTISGGVLSAVRLDQLLAGDALQPGGRVVYVDDEGTTRALSGQAVLDAATAVVQPIAKQVTTTAAAVQEARVEVARQLLGATPYAATLNGDATVITQTIDGVQVTTTIEGDTVTEVYGPPTNETWVTTITDATISKVRVA
ncbi:hypothetical protein [Roseomonas chloroacetimidivorans]|uniref:hypothetical protein n=1 Tax=Roseomonas chloroacetimidivorans TaxID=1766656 RepID=UPI003C743497